MNYPVVALAVAFATLPVKASGQKYAPLPDKVVQAKTVFLQNDSGEERLGDNVFQELQQWGRWRILTNRSEADIVIALERKPIDTKDRWRNNWYLRILDPASGEVLWIVKRSVRMMRMGNVATTLVSDLKKRLPPVNGK
jgi:hypothetical protein